MINLDTHMLLYALRGELRPREREILSSQSWSISAIVLWEIDRLFRDGRINLDIRDSEFARVLSKIHVWPIDLYLCRALQDLDFKSDPADELIAATSLFHGAALLTRDRKILASKIVPLA